jgi:uncharacterized membrane protein
MTWMIDDLALARALHVLAVTIWIGGVAMATTVALPAVKSGALGPDPLRAFEAFERRFAWQARMAVVLTGMSGLYMVHRMNLWERFRDLDFWWMHAMVGVWTVFALLLFVGEPLILRRTLPTFAARDPARAFALLHRVHIVLLLLSLITVFGAVAGSHGWPIV